MEYIASCSFGKDSIATILLALENKEPLDRIVFSEVMFDHKRGISGENPKHIEWIYTNAIPKIEKLWRGQIDIVKSELDYVTIFNYINGDRSKYKGKKRGFPIGGKCILNDRCKIRPIRQYYKQFNEVTQYIGIAIDEPIRLARLKPNQVSLLQKYNYTEKMAFELCKKYNLLSPIYESHSRGGCWFCPNSKINELHLLKIEFPNLWKELELLSETPNLVSPYFRYGKTFKEIKEMITAKEKTND